MASMFFRARVSAIAAIAAALSGGAALAADMPFLPAPEPAPVNLPTEFGTGWYLRADVGYSNMQIPVIVADFASTLGHTGAVSGNLGMGFQVNSWFRTELAVDRTVFRPSGVGQIVPCPPGTVVAYPAGTFINGVNVAGQPAGYLFDPSDTCSPQITSSFNRTSPMFNAYFDMGNWWGLTPYVGAGLGFSYLQTHGSEQIIQNWNGQPWAPNLGQNGVPLAFVTAAGAPAPMTWLPYAWGVSNAVTSTIAKKSWKFSYNLMAGVSYDVTQNVKVDLHYRFLDAGSYTGLPGLVTGLSPVTKELTSQEVRLGVRLVTD
ncbi:MAG TPA: hypothetical protein VED87_10480 [Methylocystis sp.]|nr:hypothetical protein [Methylocystis sp.]